MQCQGHAAVDLAIDLCQDGRVHDVDRRRLWRQLWRPAGAPTPSGRAIVYAPCGASMSTSFFLRCSNFIRLTAPHGHLPRDPYQSRYGTVDPTTSTSIRIFLKKADTASQDRSLFAVGPITTRSMNSHRYLPGNAIVGFASFS